MVYFVTNDLPEAQSLGFCIFFRDLAFGNDPEPGRRLSTKKLMSMTIKSRKERIKKTTKVPMISHIKK